MSTPGTVEDTADTTDQSAPDPLCTGQHDQTKGTDMAGSTPPVSYGDSFSVGQLAQHWERPTAFINDLLAQGKLTLNDQGLSPTACSATSTSTTAHSWTPDPDSSTQFPPVGRTSGVVEACAGLALRPRSLTPKPTLRGRWLSVSRLMPALAPTGRRNRLADSGTGLRWAGGTEPRFSRAVSGRCDAMKTWVVPRSGGLRSRSPLDRISVWGLGSGAYGRIAQRFM